jgi:hypothetical protein
MSSPRCRRTLPCHFAAFAFACAFVSGCGDASSPAAESTGTGDPASTGGSGSGESTGAPIDDDWPYSHGYIKLEFEVPADAPDPAILDNTATVVVAMEYGECLVSFYEANPDLQQFGEQGGPIFGDSMMGGEGWEELLCSPLFGTHAECGIVWITQRFDVVQSLTITYETMAELGAKPLLFGPIPTAATAACAEGLRPSMTIPDAMSIRGIDEAGADLWLGTMWAPMEPASRDGDPVIITIEAVGE